MVFLVTGFHRSLTSSVAHWLQLSGLNMGESLLPGNLSNPKGHFEDSVCVDLHDRFLSMQGTDWRFHDEVPIDPAVRLDLIERYVAYRHQVSGEPWGVKDPRMCLFLPAWQRVLQGEAKYIVLLRHWGECVQSLYRRHAMALLSNENHEDIHLSLWDQRALPAKIWLAYNQRVLKFLEQHKDQCLVMTQRSLLQGAHLIESVNDYFGEHIGLDASSPIRSEYSSGQIDRDVLSLYPKPMLKRLDDTWEALLSYADVSAENEEPNWVDVAVDQSMLSVSDPVLHDADQDVEPKQDERIQDESLMRELDTVGHDLRSLQQAKSYVDQHHHYRQVAWELLYEKAFQHGHLAQAREALFQYLCVGVPKGYIYLYLGDCFRGDLRFGEAEHYYNIALTMNGNNVIFHDRLMKLWIIQGKVGRAIKYAETKRKAYAKSTDWLVMQVDAVTRLLGAEEALAVLQDAPELQDERSQDWAVVLEMNVQPKLGMASYKRRFNLHFNRKAEGKRLDSFLSTIPNKKERNFAAKSVALAWNKWVVSD